MRHALLLFLVLACARTATGQAVHFDDSDPDVLILGQTGLYEIGFSKVNGAIVALTDKRTDTAVSAGSLGGSLWRVQVMDAPVTADEYSSAGPDRFEYEWTASSGTLELRYAPGDGTMNHPVGVTARVVATGQSWLDLEIDVENLDERAVTRVQFPHALGFDLGAGDEALVPLSYPGMLLESGFFENGYFVHDIYNGTWLADWIAIRNGASLIAVYGVRGDEPMVGTELGIRPAQDPQPGANYEYVRIHQPWIEPGNAWSAPRTRISFENGYLEALAAFRDQSGIAGFPTLRDKLGEIHDRVVSSPVWYVPFGNPLEAWNFTNAAPRMEPFPPGIVMLSSYWPGDFHGHHPDYVPPKPEGGTQGEFEQMIADMQAQGHLVMPFTLPVWWHEESTEILGKTPEELADIAVIDVEGNPYRRNWGDENYGYVPSLCSPNVQQRYEQIYTDAFDVYGGDMMYQDVVGARPPLYDFNASCPSVTSSSQILEDGFAAHAGYPIVVESGYDRLAEWVVGFMGALWHWEERRPVSPFGHPDGWRVYPVMTALAHDKVIPYSFWPNGEINDALVSYLTLFGMPLTAWPSDPWSPGWAPVFRDLSQRLQARIIGEPLAAWEEIGADLSRTDYGDVSVLRNASPSDEADHGQHTIARSGMWFESASADLEGGILTRYNGQALDNGTHYLVVESETERITVRHPRGEDTSVRISRPASWVQDDLVAVWAVLTGQRVAVERTVDASSVTFALRVDDLGERPISYEVLYNEEGVATERDPSIPGETAISRVYPNPGDRPVTIDFTLSEPGPGRLEVVDLLGRRVAVIDAGHWNAGPRSSTWDGRDASGGRAAPGLYVLLLRAGSKAASRPVMRVR